MAPSPQARIITEAAPPFRVVHANAAWSRLCGYAAEEAIGQEGLGFMQGEATDRVAVRRINAGVAGGERLDVTLVNYKKDGTPFLNRLRITPLRSRSGEYTHMLGLLEEVPGAQAWCPTARAGDGRDDDRAGGAA
ncbi:Blue-light-activated histidine kinase [Scenedesmus sp. PABB004]|nr:Blue-light-activated histidine kinase [Scenedesmus sp. PABB004]